LFQDMTIGHNGTSIVGHTNYNNTCSEKNTFVSSTKRKVRDGRDWYVDEIGPLASNGAEYSLNFQMSAMK
jgi:hypothetical protein